nr:MAG TPA: hypothetical protein [Caudoviricetes sp.]
MIIFNRIFNRICFRLLSYRLYALFALILCFRGSFIL